MDKTTENTNDRAERMSLQKVIDIGIQAGVKTAMEILNKEHEKKIKNRYDKRLRNTKLLLRNYNNFVEHCKNCVYTSSQLENLNAVDILDECDNIDDEELYVGAIKKTQVRAMIMVKHIDAIMEFYKYKTQRSPRIEEYRKFNVIYGVYIEEKPVSIIAEELHCIKNTVYKDIKDAIADLSTLMFGVDGINLY